MIHNTLGNTINIISTTEESRINTSVDKTNLKFLVKLTNEYSGKILYAYGTNQTITSRFTKMDLPYHAKSDIYASTINLVPVGYWKYQIFEVSYLSAPNLLDETNTPKNEVHVLPVSGEHGIVEGQVDSGKLHVHQTEGVEEVTYTKLDGLSDNYIFPYGDDETMPNVVTGDKHYTHIQTASSVSWSITHNLQKFPSVTVVDSAGTKVTGEVDYIDINSLSVSFTAEFGGIAYLN